jgi:hypothetical protein
MTLFTVTTTEQKLLEPDNDDRDYIITVGDRDPQAQVYLRLSTTGDPDLILARYGSGVIRFKLPAKLPLYSWTEAQSSLLCLMQEGQRVKKRK